jgi:hypothetical protein
MECYIRVNHQSYHFPNTDLSPEELLALGLEIWKHGAGPKLFTLYAERPAPVVKETTTNEDLTP